MIDARIVDEISNKISGLIGSGPAMEVERNVRALLQGVFAKLELVTREEFDVQTQVLLQTRNILEQLAQKVAELEKHSTLGK